MKKPIRIKKIQQMTTHDLKSYAHGQEKKAKRLRDEMAKLGNRAAAAERAECRARTELDVRQKELAVGTGLATIKADFEQAWGACLTG